MITVSFMTANYVARPLGYQMTEGWMQGENATNDFFRPLDTYGERLELYCNDIQAMGFTALDIWLPLLNPAWATPDHIRIARDVLARCGFGVSSLAGWFGTTPAEFDACCKLAIALNCQVMGGGTGLLEHDRAQVVHMLRDYGLRLGLENHPEKTPAEMLAKIGDAGGGVIGTTVDTGWYGTQSYDAADALRELAPHLMHVHLKDVRAPGGHETCRFGEGCVPIQRCVETLRQIGYSGPLCVEHEPEHFDPTEDCIASLALLKGWLA